MLLELSLLGDLVKVDPKKLPPFSLSLYGRGLG